MSWGGHSCLVVNDRDGLVMHNSGLVVHNGHDVAHDLVVHDSLMDWLVVRHSLVDQGGIMVNRFVHFRIVMNGLLVESLTAVIVAMGTLVVLHLMVSVGSLVMRMVWLVFHLVGAVSTVLGVAVSAVLVCVVRIVSVALDVAVVTVALMAAVVALVAIRVMAVTVIAMSALIIVMKTSITVVWFASIL